MILIVLLTLPGLLISSGPVGAQDSPSTTTAPMTPPVFETDSTNHTNSGSIKLTWRSSREDDGSQIAQFELQRATKPNFSDAKPYYRGPDLATYISGLSDGHYYFRVRELRGGKPLSEWSSKVEVVVEHHSLNLAFTLFGIGGLVFILTLIVVLSGAARTSNPDRETANSSITAGG